MTQHYHHGVVLLSIVVAIFASYTALVLASRLRSAPAATAPAWLAAGGFAMGTGIWAMHFIGMLAMTLPLKLAYDVPITVLSLAIAVVVSTFALRIAGGGTLNARWLAAAGIAMGIGICSMHYVGMAAIVIDPPLDYDLRWVAISLAIAILASLTALGVAFARRDDGIWRWRNALGATGMGIAIAGMHYAGMAGVEFPAGATSAPGGLSDHDTSWLTGVVAVVTTIVLGSALLISAAEMRRTRMQASLNEARDESRAKDEFLAMLGHELRNPMASITNAVRIVERAQPGGREWTFAIGVLKRQSSHLGRLVDDMLDVSRAISGKIRLEPRPIDLDGVVRSSLASLATAGRTSRRRIDYRGERATVHGDATRLEQVVTNLVLNATEATADGGLIELRLTREGERARLVIRDDGIGLDPDSADRVFDLFYQVDQDIARQKGGLGIGLTLVRSIVALHRGEIGVSSPGPGRGASFTVTLPLTGDVPA
ncbi:MAG TPA: MHYT domain-containing protein [Burkholderiaceae bacterium]|nr:MHYT domain-containing protein [Burkholderiaceae bacterium]